MAVVAFSLIAEQAAATSCTSTTYDPTRVCYLAPFAYTNSPDPQCNGRADNSYVSEIQNAIDIAPPPIQVKICDLYNIFVTDDPSFGWWSADSGKTFIGLNKSVFNKNYSNIETTIHKNLLAAIGANTTISWQITVTPNVLDTMPEFGLLSVMAHELGHIKFAMNSNLFLDEWTNCGTSSMCFYNDFICRSWNQHYLGGWRGRKWTLFGKDVSTKHQRGIPHFSDIKDDSNAKDVCKTLQLREFVGLFGSVAPDEDYVEMYRLRVLFNAQNTPLQKITTTFQTASKYTCTASVDSSNLSSVLTEKRACALSIGW
jgi:hypothetical protein